MLHVTLDEAAAHLGDLMSAARRGEAVVIVNGPEAVQLVPVTAPSETPRKRRQFGSAAGKIHLAPDFDAPLDDFADYKK
jgi:prevent-host-death family protein